MNKKIEPTKKSKGVEDFLTEMAGISRQDAADQRICVLCKNPAVNFRDKLSEKEYSISGMCQQCQDSAFGG